MNLGRLDKLEWQFTCSQWSKRCKRKKTRKTEYKEVKQFKQFKRFKQFKQFKQFKRFKQFKQFKQFKEFKQFKQFQPHRWSAIHRLQLNASSNLETLYYFNWNQPCLNHVSYLSRGLKSLNSASDYSCHILISNRYPAIHSFA